MGNRLKLQPILRCKHCSDFPTQSVSRLPSMGNIFMAMFLCIPCNSWWTAMDISKDMAVSKALDGWNINRGK
jgi:hypothetical protein